MSDHFSARLHYWTPYAVEAEDLSHYLLGQFSFTFILGVENVLLEKSVFPVHVSAVEKAIPVYDIVPESFPDVAGVVIFFVLEVVLVRVGVFDLDGFRGLVLCLGGFIFFYIGFAVVEGSLKSA